MSETCTVIDPDTGEVIFPATSGKHFIYDYYAGLPDLAGKTVVDIPCGDGRASHIFRQRGADVIALDLFPKFMKAPGITARMADLRQPLPLADECADYVICQEGIEHIPDQLAALCEFNRILKPGGQLVITCPSISHARARLAHLLVENDSWRRMPPSVVDTVWVTNADVDRIYFGHLFLIGVQRLTTLLGIAGFRVTERRRTDIGASSVVLGVLFYPLVALASLLAYRTYARKQRKSIPPEVGKPVWWEHLVLNLSPTTLFCKHVFWVAQKECSTAERRSQIRASRVDRYHTVAD
ncbi:MAG: methyltransferase domain-containing protein [Gammaproteobacteria bacterium]|nr:methyltransferase domain-containing protein [Gammaproteobacteria bacterium]